MRLSTKGQYAVLALLDIEKHSREYFSNKRSMLEGDKKFNVVRLDDISKRQDISISYLEQIFMKLRRAGLVKSVRGPGGGYKLAKRASDITIKVIMDAVREDFQTTRCKDNRIFGCAGDKKCVGHDFWLWFSNSMETLLDRVSLADIIDNNLPNVDGYGFFFKDNCSTCSSDAVYEKTDFIYEK